MSHPLEQIKQILADMGVKAATEGKSWFDVRCGPAILHIQERPAHCDRGRFIVMADTQDILKLALDSQDGFPRYYFDPVCCGVEVGLWLSARGLLAATIRVISDTEADEQP